MGCGGCRKGGGNRHTSTGGDLKKFAYLTPRQLRLLKSKEKPKSEDTSSEDQEPGQD